MRAVSFAAYGGPDVLTVAEVPEPHAGPGQVRIQVRAAAVNPVDVKQRRGDMSGGKPLEQPTVPGYDGAGVVDEVGDGVTDVAVGDEVLGLGQRVQAEYAVLASWVPKPADLEWGAAAALGVAGETAARGLTLLGTAAGDTVFIDGASGGVGKLAVQLAIARGARVVGSGSEQKQELIAGLGAEPVVYGEGVADRVKALADHVDGVFDTAGKTPAQELIALVDTAHDVVTIANFGAGATGIQITGGGSSGPDPVASLTEVTDLWRAGGLRIEVDDTLPFERAAEGQRAAEAGTTKVVLVP